MKRRYRFLIYLIVSLLFLSCGREQNEVIIYCSLDRMYSEPILADFEEETGIDVRAVYDTELTKTVGLVNRLIAESDNPHCDVFWNNEICRTILLQNKGILQPWLPPNAGSIPKTFRDPSGYWTGFAARARIIIYNKDKFAGEELPRSIHELINPKWNGRAALAYPLFGTTATHAAVLYDIYGKEKATRFFEDVRDNGILILDGNATVRDQVVAGEAWWGFTDTDDANAAIVDGKNVGIVYPDQGEDEMGMLVIPNTIAMIHDCPNPENARKLINFILRPEIEERLARARSAQIPVRRSVPAPGNVVKIEVVKVLDTDFTSVTKEIEPSARILNELFIR